MLVAGWSSLASAAQQIPIIAAFVRAGYAPVVTLELQLTPSRELYEVGWRAGAGVLERSAAGANQGGATYPDGLGGQLRVLEHDGLRVGRYALSTMMRSTRCGKFDFTDSGREGRGLRVAAETLDGAAFADQLIERWKPYALLVTDQGYTPLGPLFERCVNAGIPAYSWNAAHRDNLVALKRYGRDNIDSHPCRCRPRPGKRCAAVRGPRRIGTRSQPSRPFLPVRPMVRRGGNPVRQGVSDA